MKEVRRPSIILTPFITISVITLLSCAHDNSKTAEHNSLLNDLMLTSSGDSTVEPAPHDLDSNQTGSVQNGDLTDASTVSSTESQEVTSPTPEPSTEDAKLHAEVSQGTQEDFAIPGSSSDNKLALVAEPQVLSNDSHPIASGEIHHDAASSVTQAGTLSNEIPPAEKQADLALAPSAANPLANSNVSEIPQLMPESTENTISDNENKALAVIQSADEKAITTASNKKSKASTKQNYKEQVEEAPIAATEKDLAEEAAKLTAKPRIASSITSLPSQPVWRKGDTLNRYYVLRTGDTQESLSNLFYGSPDRAEKLAAWNPNWNVGSVIFYLSEANPNDSQIMSFYDEQKIEPETYIVKKGERLSQIAKEVYGDSLAWKEIAILNHMQSPVKATSGMTLKLYPAKLEHKTIVSTVENPVRQLAAENNVLQSTNPATLPISQVELNSTKILSNKSELSSNMVASRQKPLYDDEPGYVTPKKHPKAPHMPNREQLASPQVGGFFTHHLLITAATLGGLLGLFLLFKWFRKPESFDMED